MKVINKNYIIELFKPYALEAMKAYCSFGDIDDAKILSYKIEETKLMFMSSVFLDDNYNMYDVTNFEKEYGSILPFMQKFDDEGAEPVSDDERGMYISGINEGRGRDHSYVYFYLKPKIAALF